MKLDAMPLHQRMQLTPKIRIPSAESPLQSQPLSPTKLKVSRQPNKLPTSTPKVIEIAAPAEEVCLRWNSHHSNMQTSFPHLLELEKYVDVTLIAEGKSLKCHRMILSSCSPYFEEILSGISPFQHPVVILNGVPFWILKMLTDFMYAGEVNIDQNKVPELLDVAEILKVKGLASKTNTAPSDSIKKENNAPKQLVEKNNSHNKQTPNLFSPKPSVIPKSEVPSLCDPLQLLETKFLEVPSPKPKEYRPFAKKLIKKHRKRKSSEEDCSTPSPPVFPIRRGTRSRPYVKGPKYYDYEDIVKPISGAESPLDPPTFSPVHIKSEPLDVDEMESLPTNETPTCSDTMSEYTDINDIASKLQSLEKVIDIQPIPHRIEAKPTGIVKKSIVPYKIKIKNLSSITGKASPPITHKVDISSVEKSGHGIKHFNDISGIEKSENVNNPFTILNSSLHEIELETIPPASCNDSSNTIDTSVVKSMEESELMEIVEN